MFHWFDEKHNQKKLTRWTTLVSAATLAAAGIVGFSYALKGASLQTA